MGQVCGSAIDHTISLEFQVWFGFFFSASPFILRTSGPGVIAFGASPLGVGGQCGCLSFVHFLVPLLSRYLRFNHKSSR
jgi:hypothetical protein